MAALCTVERPVTFEFDSPVLHIHRSQATQCDQNIPQWRVKRQTTGLGFLLTAEAPGAKHPCL